MDVLNNYIFVEYSYILHNIVNLLNKNTIITIETGKPFKIIDNQTVADLDFFQGGEGRFSCEKKKGVY